MNEVNVYTKGTLGLPESKKENPRRGAAMRSAAIDFTKRWPIGSSLTWDEFTGWAVEHRLLDAIPSGEDMEDKQSNAWLAHLQRRHQIRNNLNKASAHSELIPYGGAFVVSAIGGALVVRSTAAEIAEGEVPKRIRSLANTRRKKLEYLIQSTDWSQLPPHEQAIAEALRDDIDFFVRGIELGAESLETKFSKLRNRISGMIADGRVSPTNGGISGLLKED